MLSTSICDDPSADTGLGINCAIALIADSASIYAFRHLSALTVGAVPPPRTVASDIFAFTKRTVIRLRCSLFPMSALLTPHNLYGIYCVRSVNPKANICYYFLDNSFACRQFLMF